MKKNGRPTASLAAIATAVAVIAVSGGVFYLYTFLGGGLLWAACAAAVTAFGSTLATSSMILYPMTDRRTITKDLEALSEKADHHFQNTLAAIQKNGEETRMQMARTRTAPNKI